MKTSTLEPFIKKLVVFSMLFLCNGCSDRDEFTTELAMQSDAMAIANYYYPKQIALTPQPTANLKLPSFKSRQPRFGELNLGDSEDSVIALALDEIAATGESFLYVDRNNNEDLTDDGDPSWDDDKGGYWVKEALIDVHYRLEDEKAAVPYPVTFYRFKRNHPNTIVAYRSGYREGQIALRDTTYRIAVLDDDVDGLFTGRGAIIIDLNRDGHLDGQTDSPEHFSIHAPFNVAGVTYRVKGIAPSGNFIKIAVADTAVFPKASLSAGTHAPLIRTTSITGELIDLADFRNKVVLLDFWASHCQPWEEELPYLKRVYNRYHERGFEIIGINLDYNLETVNEFVKSNGIPWTQVSSGRGWEMSVVDIFNVDALPRNFLLDRNGMIRYKNLYGNSLSARVRELLNEPESMTP